MNEINMQYFSDLTSTIVAELERSAFIDKCKTGTVKSEHIRLFMQQHYHFSRKFTTYLLNLASNLENVNHRTVIIRNIAEELGGDDDSALAHSMILFNIMERYDISLDPIHISVETEYMIKSMVSLCEFPDPLLGLGALCFGAEAIVPCIYQNIIEGMETVGGFEGAIPFFAMHIDCDDGHADAMRMIAAELLEHNPQGKLDLEYGAFRLARCRKNLFDRIGAI